MPGLVPGAGARTRSPLALHLGERLLAVEDRALFGRVEALHFGRVAPDGLGSADAMEKILPSARVMVTALGIEINQAAELLTGTMKSFGMELGDTNRVVDVFVNAWQNSAADAEKLGNALKYIGFTAGVTGQSLEQVVALIGVLVDRNQDATQAGTVLRNIFQTLRRADDDLIKSLEQVGLTYDDVNPKTRSFFEILENLAELSPEAFLDTFNTRGLAVAETLVKLIRGGEGVGFSLKTLERALHRTGTALEMVEKQSQGLQYRWNVARGSAQIFFVELGSLITRTIDVKGGVSSLAESLNDLSETLSRISGESLSGLFKGIKDDFEAGAFVTLLQEWVSGIWTVAEPLMVWLGGNLGIAIAKGISSSSSYIGEQVLKAVGVEVDLPTLGLASERCSTTCRSRRSSIARPR